MTAVLRLIHRELNRDEKTFFVPVRELEEDDNELIEREILTYNGDYLRQAPCPECGRLAHVERKTKDEGETTFLYCQECCYLGWQKIEPREVDLLRFSFRKFMLYINDADVEGEYVEAAAQCWPRESRKPKRSKRAVGGKGPQTEFMKRQLRTFRAFLKSEKYDGNLSKINQFAQRCWRKNKTTWDRAANATGQNKGYSSYKALANSYRRSV